MRNTLMLIEPQEQSDPRLTLEPETLALAQRNAFPLVAQRGVRKDNLGLAVGVAGALLLGGATFWSMSGSRTAEPSAAPAKAQVEPARDLAIPSEAFTNVPSAATGPGAAAIPAPVAVGQGAVDPRLLMPPAPGQQPAPALVFDGSAPGVATSAEAPQATGLSGDEAFAARVGSGGPEVAVATKMANPGHTVSQGTLIPAVLETAINSDLPGYVRAVVSMDVRSFDGSRVLVPRSSRLIGQYKSGVAGGQTRAYVMWTRLIRPDGVSVALASPAVDATGQTGLTGDVDSHFFKRFGSSILLSVIGAASALTGGGGALILSGGSNAASVAAQQNGQIPPTIKVRQGQPIRVFTAKDLDFSTVSGGRG